MACGLEETNGCCGLGELHGLYGDKKDLLPKIQALLDEETGRKKTGSGCDCGACGGYENYFGCVFATTVKSQKGAIAALEEKGFTILHKFTNPKTDNVVTVWVWTHPDFTVA